MISHDTFKLLQHATSKNPIKLFTDDKLTELEFDAIPDPVRNFLNNYLREKIDTLNIDKKSIRVSVNEAPATYAKQVCKHDDISKLLAGDAGLGLSYFKGLNAGLESTAKFFTLVGPAIEKSAFKDQKHLKEALTKYQSWFIDEFAPKKVKEVENYSTWRIRLPMKVIKATQFSKMASMVEELDIYGNIIKDLLLFLDPKTSAEIINNNQRLYLHRDYDPVQFGQLKYVPLQHTATKITKLFSDYFKPYKSGAQAIQDFKQPLVGIGNLGVSLIKIIKSPFTLAPKLAADGLFTFLRGLVEIGTTPLAWVIKPITRGLASLIAGQPKIEDAVSMQKLSKLGQEALAHPDTDKSESKQKFELIAIVDDLHRKFNKSQKRGEESNIVLKEQEAYSAIRSHPFSPKRLNRYFSLFSTEAVK